jgi:hypothetical protein
MIIRKAMKPATKRITFLETNFPWIFKEDTSL